jgi:hypothetical protein
VHDIKVRLSSVLPCLYVASPPVPVLPFLSLSPPIQLRPGRRKCMILTLDSVQFLFLRGLSRAPPFVGHPKLFLSPLSTQSRRTRNVDKKQL